MKKIYWFLLTVILATNVFAQAPEKISYQAVIRNSSNALVTNQAVGLQISILQGNISGAATYIETHSTNTNTNGLVSLEIGSGTAISGSFNSIDWSNGPFFIKTETDPTGGTAYTITGTSELMSVPYALHANTADSIVGGISFTEVDGSITNEIQDLQLSGNNLTITNNGTATTIDLSPYLDNINTQLDSADIANFGYNAGGITAEVDGSVTNEIQDLQLLGNNLTITNNGTATTIDLSQYLDNTNTQLDSTDIANFGYNAGGITAEVDGSVTNEIQTLTVSQTGDTLSISGGNSVLVPGISLLNFPLPVIGEFREGGIVFWIDPADSTKGLVVGLTNLSPFAEWWVCNSQSASGLTNFSIGTGLSNSTTINANCPSANSNTAADLCLNSTNDGYSDWFLPSRDELFEINNNLAAVEAGLLANFGLAFTTGQYWSSNEAIGPGNLAVSVSLTTGSVINSTKDTQYRVRAIRAF